MVKKWNEKERKKLSCWLTDYTSLLALAGMRAPFT
jgi:hypothetical protein